jgi:hypothetical protein
VSTNASHRMLFDLSTMLSIVTEAMILPIFLRRLDATDIRILDAL